MRPPRARGLGRTRLHSLLSRVWDHRLALVVAPAGSGKTTALTHFAGASGAPVAWYRAEGSDLAEPAFLAHLERSCATAVEGLRTGWESAEDAAAALDEVDARLLIVVDDLHTLHGSPAEAALERLVGALPPGCPVLAGTRRPPSFALSRLRVEGDLLEIGPEELRFRAWEVEQLFIDVYGDRLAPGELSTLTQRTEGWAAGLQLYHLASRGKSRAERLRLLSALGSRSRLVREYLADNVLGDLPPDLRRFLVRTSVLTLLTGALCDELLGADRSAEVLADLEVRQLFCVALDEAGTYRYHEVLRSHLEGELSEELGAGAAREEYRRAGALYEKGGWQVEAVRAYSRAEDWDAVARLLEAGAEDIAGQPGAWVDALPHAVVADDPWLILASARRSLAHGRLQAAGTDYVRAEQAFATGAGANAARAERSSLRPWLTPTPDRVGGPSGLLRSATMRDPLAAAREAAGLPGPAGRLVEGVALVLAGCARDGQKVLLGAAGQADQSPTLAVAARAAAALAPLWGPADRLDPAAVAEDAEALGVPWVARLGAAAVALTGDGPLPTGLRESFDVELDEWGAAGFALHLGLALLARAEPALVVLDEAAARLRFLGADVLEVWARAAGAHALAADDRVGAVEAARTAAEDARRLGVPAAAAFALLAAGRADPARGSWRQRAQGVLDAARLPPLPAWAYPGPGADGDAHGPASAAAAPAPPPAALVPPPAAPPAVLQCIGRFRLEIGGHPVDLGAVKPRARALLRLLGAHAPAPVHREVLCEALWPEADADAATRNLQVAISSLRQLLEPGVGRGGHTLLVRDGDAYKLDLPLGSEIDLAAFTASVAAGRAAAAVGDTEAAARRFRQALELYTGDLLPEDGPADWAVARREQVRADAAEAAVRLGELCLAAADPKGAVAACEQGLRADRYRDALWRLLGEAHRLAGDAAAAARAERDYAAVLEELGVA